MSLAACGEFGLIERIRAQVAGRADLLIGIGDDCCATALPPGEILLTTTDLLLEAIHFRRAWTDLYSLGRKAVAVNISDIAAMGGTPQSLSLGLALPADLALRHHQPVARLRLGQELARRQLATALIDLSDGLRADLGHILDSSGVGARVNAAALPLSASLRAALTNEPGLIDLALAGGEDYELLWSAPPSAAAALAALGAELELPLTCIGEVIAGAGLLVTAADGRELISTKAGYNHFG